MKKAVFLTILIITIFMAASCASSDSDSPTGGNVTGDNDNLSSDNSNPSDSDNPSTTTDSDDLTNDSNPQPDSAQPDGALPDNQPEPDETPADTTPPEVTSIEPADKTAEVAINTKIKIKFSESINAGTVEKAILLKTETNTIDGTVSFESASEISFTPKEPLSFLTTYTLYIPSTVQDLAGNKIKPLADKPEYAAVVSFTTVNDPNPPKIKSKSPDASSVYVKNDAKIRVVFDRPVTKLADKYIVLKDGATELAGTVTLKMDTIEFQPTAPLVEEKSYTVEIIKDTIAAEKNPAMKFEGATWEFKVSTGVIFFDDFDGNGFPSPTPEWNCLAHDYSNNCNTLKLWDIGIPDFKYKEKGYITQDYDADGEKAMGTFSIGYKDYYLKGYPTLIEQSTYLSTPLAIPSTGAVLEFYAYAWTQLDMTKQYADGMYIVLCNSATCMPGQADYVFLTDITEESGMELDLVGKFANKDGSWLNNSFKGLGIRGRVQDNTYVKFSVNIPAELTGQKYLHFVFSSEQSGSSNAPSEYGTNGAGIYLDDIVVRGK